MANNLSVVLGADTSGFVTEVKGARHMLEKYREEAKKASGEISKNATATNEQIASYERVVKSLEKITNGSMTTSQQQKALTQQIQELKIQWADLSNEVKAGDFGQMITSSLQASQDRLASLSTQINQASGTVSSFGAKQLSVKAQLKQAQMALTELTAQYRAMSDTERASVGGQELAAKMDELRAKAGSLKDTIGDVGQEISAMASDTPNLDAFNAAIGIGANAMSTYSSIIAKVTGDEEALKDAISTVMMVQSAANLLTQVTNALQSSSVIMLKARQVQELALAGATKLTAVFLGVHAAAMGADAVATTGATLATKLFQKALIATGIGAIVVAIGSLIAYWDDLTTIVKASFTAFTDFIGVTSEEERAAEKAAEAEKKRAEAIRSLEQESVKQLNSEGEKVAKLKQLQSQINNTKLSEQERVKAMKKANEESGKEIYNLKETKKYLNGMDKSINAYIKNMVAEAKAKAILNKIGALYLDQLYWEENARKNGAGEWTRKHIADVKAQQASLQKELESIQATTKAYGDYKKEKSSSSGGTGSNNGLKERNSLTKEEVTILEKKENAIKKLKKAQENAKLSSEEFNKQLAALEKDLFEYKVKIGLEFDPESYEGLKEQLKKLDETQLNPDLRIDPNEYKRLRKELEDKIQAEGVRIGVLIDLNVTKAKEIIKKYFENAQMGEAILNTVTIKSDKTGYDAKKPVLQKVEVEPIIEQKKHAIEVEFEANAQSINDLWKQITDNSTARTEIYEVMTNMKNSHEGEDPATWAEDERNAFNSLQQLYNSIEGSNDVLKNQKEELIGKNEELAESYNEIIKKEREMAKNAENFTSITDSIGTMGSALSSLGQGLDESAGAWLGFAGTAISSGAQMMQQLASLVVANQAAATAKGIESASGLAFPFNLAAIATVVATITSMFAALPKFASGGIVGGNSMHGDFNLARVNSGEMILNGSQQKRLFNLLNSGAGIGAVHNNNNPVEFKIKGSTLVGVQRNYNKKQSRL